MYKINEIIERTKSKIADYQKYNFSQKENDALKTFFDLSQEFDSIEDFYKLCVAIPKSFFDKEARLYIVDPKLHSLVLTLNQSQCKRILVHFAEFVQRVVGCCSPNHSKRLALYAGN